MSPFIRTGDTLHVGMCNSPKSGDILVFLSDGKCIAHRLVRVQHGPAPRLITRGDALEQEDPPLAPADVLGRVIAISRNGRKRSMTGPPARLAAWVAGRHVAGRPLLPRLMDFRRNLVRWRRS